MEYHYEIQAWSIGWAIVIRETGRLIEVFPTRAKAQAALVQYR